MFFLYSIARFKFIPQKYKKPAQGEIFSKAGLLNTDKQKVIEELDSKQRTLITVRVSLYDTGGNHIIQSDFEWFIAKRV